MTWRWDHFQPKEVLSPDGLKLWEENHILQLRPESLDRLEALREELASPILVNHGDLRLRGYRSPEENASILGAKFSAHVLGCAFDVTCHAYDLHTIASNAVALGFVWVKLYHDKGFVHIEDRWRGQ